MTHDRASRSQLAPPSEEHFASHAGHRRASRGCRSRITGDRTQRRDDILPARPTILKRARQRSRSEHPIGPDEHGDVAVDCSSAKVRPPSGWQQLSARNNEQRVARQVRCGADRDRRPDLQSTRSDGAMSSKWRRSTPGHRTVSARWCRSASPAAHRRPGHPPSEDRMNQLTGSPARMPRHRDALMPRGCRRDPRWGMTCGRTPRRGPTPVYDPEQATVRRNQHRSVLGAATTTCTWPAGTSSGPAAPGPDALLETAVIGGPEDPPRAEYHQTNRGHGAVIRTMRGDQVRPVRDSLIYDIV